MTLWPNPYMHNNYFGISPENLIFRNVPKPIIDLYDISFLCANFETSTILLCNCIDIRWTSLKRTKFHCDSRISEQRCFCPAMKNVGARCLTRSKPERVESPPLSIYSFDNFPYFVKNYFNYSIVLFYSILTIATFCF